jgi:hypothetical protein
MVLTGSNVPRNCIFQTSPPLICGAAAEFLEECNVSLTSVAIKEPIHLGSSLNNEKIKSFEFFQWERFLPFPPKPSK